MRSDIVAIANRLIPKPKSIELVSSSFVTDDIIKSVLSHYEKHKNQLAAFAPHLKGDTVEETCYNVWKFWQQHIKYVRDNVSAGQQIVKSPAAVWADKFSDCKSFSIAAAVCLHALNIKCVFRFVSFNPDMPTIVTHVYVVAYNQGKEIIIDCCLQNFNMQQAYAKKYDYLPAGLHAVNGPMLRKRVAINPHKQRGKMCFEGVKTEAEMELLIRKAQLELEQIRAAKIHGIGSVADNAYEIELAAVNNAICEIANPRLRRFFNVRSLKPAETFIGSPAQREEFIGKKNAEKKAAKKAKKVEKKTAKAVKKNAAGKALNKKQAKLVEKTGAVVKKKKEGILKKIAKVVTAPVRLVQKGILEATLPKSAPAFLYLFITDQRVLAKAPPIVITKRNKAMAHADRVVNKIGMKRDHLMGILRNGIMQNMGDTPENILAAWMRDAGFSVGFVTEAVNTAVNVLGNLLGGKAAALMADAPDPSDWGTAPDTQSAEILQQQPTNNDPALPQGGSIPIAPVPQLYNQAQNTGFNYGSQPDSSSNNYSSSYIPQSPAWDKPANENPEDFESGEGKDLENVTVTSDKKAVDDKGDSTGILLLAGVALLAFSR